MTDTTNETASPSTDSDAPNVFDRIDAPIKGSGDEDTIRESVKALNEKRQRDWEQGAISDDAFAEQNAPVLERKYPKGHGAKSLKQASEDLSDAHRDEKPEAVWAAARHGVEPAQMRQYSKDPEWVAKMRPDWNAAEVSEYVRTGAMPPTKIGLVTDKGLRIPLRDDQPAFELPANSALNLRDAAREVRQFRIAAAEAQEALLAELTAQSEQPEQGEQQTAVEQQSTPQPTTQQTQAEPQQQPDPVEVERVQLAQAAQVYQMAAAATEAERRCSDQINAWQTAFTKSYPESAHPAAVEEVRVKNPARFAKMQADAARAKQHIDNFMRAGAEATAIRQANENALAQHQHAQTRAAWHSFKSEQDKIAAQRIPELADVTKAGALRQATHQMLRDVGFANEDVSAAWDGQTGFSLRDGRVQVVLADAARYRQMMANKNAIAEKRVQPPPVQKPGTYRPRGADGEADIARLQRELDGATGNRALHIATRLTQARRSAGY
jgi:hypothetical protein